MYNKKCGKIEGLLKKKQIKEWVRVKVWQGSRVKCQGLSVNGQGEWSKEKCSKND